MHKVSIDGIQQSICNTQDMKIGEIAMITELGVYDGMYIMRIYSGFVLLNDPNFVWGEGLRFKVYPPLPAGTRLTIEVDCATRRL